MKIGVIIPSYNRPLLLKRCIEELKKQSNTNWLAIIVDDCSKIDTYSNISTLIQNDKRIEYYKLIENKGVNFARNYALEIMKKNTSITHITLLDDDDYFITDYFEEISELIKKNDYKWIVTKCVREDKSEITNIKEYGYIDYLDYLTNLKMTNDASMLIDIKLLEDVRFSDEVKNGLEWYFFLQVSTKSKMFVVDLKSKIVNYQEEGLSNTKLTYNKRKYLKKYLKKFNYKYFKFLTKKSYASYLNTGKKKYLFKFYLYKIISILE